MLFRYKFLIFIFLGGLFTSLEAALPVGRQKEYARKQREGYCWEIKNSEGMIVDMGTVPPYSEFTYTQPIPKEIGTAKYRVKPFYMREKGQIKIHTKNYMTYKNSMMFQK